MEGKKTET
jgi:hypothetical protein